MAWYHRQRWSGSHHWSWYGHRATLYDCIETIDGIGGIENCTQRTIRIDHRVGTLDYISIAYLLLALAVTRNGILYVVGIGVLWMRIDLCVDGQCSREQAAFHRDGEESAAQEETLQGSSRTLRLTTLLG